VKGGVSGSRAALTPRRSTAAPHRTEACLWLCACDVDRPMFRTCEITYCDLFCKDVHWTKCIHSSHSGYLCCSSKRYVFISLFPLRFQH